MLGAEPGAADGVPRARGAAAALADRVATLRASAGGAGGAISVTVSSSGNVTGLELADEALALGGSDLAVEILRTIRRAQSGLADQVEAAIAATVGAETETGKAVLDSFTQRFPVEAEEPVMPAPKSLTFQNTPTLPHQAPGNGFESGRDSRAR
ncbi:hypothetical protein ACTI_29770 [Actinoplanes sp. OR16]|uniref:YbaB/EbfC family nucleoid-associated protein n=1 Tax=Actinoplanes sp. OR16 TaxID=946334 RepID=UPI000F6E6076|nr:YbaB/EbfC family nucleoid-associated protein [Actinoplanes sp. OR16]BBH66292.1 hypothetical protein ACTI_29770 [Actinoplanes sp. OR16]